MKEISAVEFLAKVETGQIEPLLAVGKIMYGRDRSYSFERAQAGKLYEVVKAVHP